MVCKVIQTLRRKCWPLERRKSYALWSCEERGTLLGKRATGNTTEHSESVECIDGQKNTPKLPVLLKVASSDHKEQTRVGKVTSKLLRLSNPKPQYNSVPSKTIWLSLPGSSNLALPSSPTPLLPLNFEDKKPRELTPPFEVQGQVLVVFAEIK